MRRPSNTGSEAGPAHSADAFRLERTIALGRAYLAVASLVAIWIDPTEPSRYAGLIARMLVGYAAYAVVVLVLVHRTVLRPWARAAFHAADLAAAAAISLFSDGPNSPFFLYFVFVLLGAAYRWGLRGTLLTTAIAIVLHLAQAAMLTRDRGTGLALEGELEVNRFVMRAVYLLLMGYLLGFLGDSENRLRREAAAVTDVLVRVRPGAGIRETLHLVLERIAVHFDAAAVIVPILDVPARRAYVWEAWRTRGGALGPLRVRDLEPSQWREHLIDWRSDVAVSWPDLQAGPSALVLDAEGARVREPVDVPPMAAAAREARRLMAVPFVVGAEWSGWLLLLDPPAGKAGARDLRLLQRVVREAAPAVHGAYLLRRLRSRVGAAERARLARDLHDGLIQALVGIEMRLAALRRAPPPEARARDHELDEIRRLLRSEVLNARELMDHLRPLDVAPRELLGVLAENVSRFQRETGIAAEFLADTAEVDLAPRTCREVVQILREALTNVRKHSDARNVLVRVALEDGAMKLIVDDDGRGFPFAGTLGPSDLEARRLGPAVIKERVRAVAGELTIDSVPGRGARLEVRVPTSAHA